VSVDSVVSTAARPKRLKTGGCDILSLAAYFP
jgi:hypothetical protein